MPGEISRSNPGPPEGSPYVPSWCYEGGRPRVCSCGDHEGYHNDADVCLRQAQCGCKGADYETTI